MFGARVFAGTWRVISPLRFEASGSGWVHRLPVSRRLSSLNPLGYIMRCEVAMAMAMAMT